MAEEKNVKEITLRVAEAYYRDVGRGIARIDPEVMAKLGLQSGDVVEIIGKSSVPAIVWPGYPEDRGKGIIRIDGSLRNNAGVGIDDRVRVRKVEAKPAEKVTLAPTEPVRLMGGEAYLLRLLEGRPVTRGQKIRVELFGHTLTFVVTATKPAGVVIVSRNTAIELKEKPVEGVERAVPNVTYEDIGGLKRELRLVREMIELPLKHPELFQRLGIDPPKGVLLYGPPGTGKTLIAKAVANEVNAHFISISGPEIMSKYYGESEQRLREIFEEAKENAPSIIFIDEIDSIAPKREEVTGEVERRVVAQLLALMDGLEARGDVIVIAATNRPDAIDPALRRPGRFDREIEIGVPDKEGRKEILEIHTRGMPLAEDVDLDELAELTIGFVGADLEALCKEAAMHALRSRMEKGEIDIEAEEIPEEVLENLKVTREDFLEALKNIEPSAMREVLVEVPNVRWSDIGGLDKAKQELMEAVEWPLKYPEVFNAANIKPPKGILLYGPPGTGKTLLAKAVANQTNATFIRVVGSEFVQKYIGEGARLVREVFQLAKEKAPSIIFIDEIDAIAAKRTNSDTSGDREVQRTLMQLLAEMDGFDPRGDIKIIGATNRIDILDPAILRPGRFDRIIETPLPNHEGRLAIFKIHTRSMKIDSDVDLNELASITEGASGADIKAIVTEAGMLAIRNGRTVVKMDDFIKAVEKVMKKQNKPFELKGVMFV